MAFQPCGQRTAIGQPAAQYAGSDRCGAPVDISGDGVHGFCFLLNWNYRINDGALALLGTSKPNNFCRG
jgi:hypothetical protein